MVQSLDVIIEELKANVDHPFYCLDHLVKCKKDYHDFFELIPEGRVQYCDSSSMDILFYHDPIHLYVIMEQKPKIGDYIPLRDNSGKFVGYVKCDNDEQYINQIIIGSTNKELVGKNCYALDDVFMRVYANQNGFLPHAHIVIDNNSLVIKMNASNNNVKLVDYNKLRSFLERNIIPDGNPALILEKLDDWYKKETQK